MSEIENLEYIKKNGIRKFVSNEKKPDGHVLSAVALFVFTKVIVIVVEKRK